MKTRFVVLLMLGLSFSPVAKAFEEHHADVPSPAIRCEFADRMAEKDKAIALEAEAAKKKNATALDANG